MEENTPKENKIEFLNGIILFFDKFQWLFNVPVTQILVEDCLNQFPEDWVEVLTKLDNNKLNNFVTNAQTQSHWPVSLKNFVKNCKKYNHLPETKILNNPSKLPECFMKNLSFKKQHEIFHLTQVIHEKCLLHHIKFIVDFGAGLGYICQLLNYLYGYKILGLESNEKNVQKAKERQASFFPDSSLLVKYVCHKISNESSKSIEEYIEQEFGEMENICLIGLHACGDLSVFMSKIFLEMCSAKLLILVSCCYHKLTLTDEKLHNDNHDYKKDSFKYFPVSGIAKKMFDDVKTDTQKIFNRPFMRLACQETSDRWNQMLEETHNEHSFYVLARAVLELYGAQNGMRLKKVTRSGIKKSHCTSFQSYLDECEKKYIFEKVDIDKESCTIPWDEGMKNAIKILWKDCENEQKKLELYTALQLLLQQAAETLILTDRMYYFEENSCNVDLISVMNKALSPRCCAMVVSKK